MDDVKKSWKGWKAKLSKAVGGEPQWKGSGRVLGGGSDFPPAEASFTPELVDAVGLLAGVDPPMASATSSLLLKLLGNVLSQPGEARFRRLRLNNPVLRGSILETEGGLDLLLAAGFQLQPGDEADGGFAVLEPGADLAPLRAACQMLRHLNATEQPAGDSRAEPGVLMTAAMRERAAARARAAAGTRDHAVVRVRLPEGISLQGEFDGREPVAAVLQWVTDSLSDPMNTWTGESARAMRSTPTLRPDLCAAALSAAD
ncbi:hypothetical protein F751_0255 [Auxenochlorella protothecoides]|uniref:PUB domain-containing protein n=1 Tax=Auxenochlorella protothecoides TaxID=3075 RepID=A0A087SPC9_AUXPR|nr:hypothetical protein F751_0255 [Auxenochlorella protothecoides]KFM27583.1 hypothetical protein F751_0255 [Auxenochlorella protothecoides]